MSSDPINYMTPESESIESAMKSGNKVRVFTHEKRVFFRRVDVFIGFEPTGGDLNPAKGIGVIYYPGANVSPNKYAPMARALAELGYHVAICDFPLNVAVLDFARADEVIDFDPWKGVINSWIISGHSLGGAMAAKYVNKLANDKDRFGTSSLKGVALHASYPHEDHGIRGLDLNVYSIYAELDGLTSLEEIEKSKDVLPKDTKFIQIDGGNHTQYYYTNKLQEKDNEATISRDEQQIEIRKATHKLLIEIDEASSAGITVM